MPETFALQSEVRPLARRADADHTPMHTSLSAALAAAQAEFGKVVKDRVGQARGAKYRYADLTAVLDEVRPAFARHGIAIVQGGEHLSCGWVLATTLLWQDAEITRHYPLEMRGTAQERGSEWTYARRYALLAAAGVHPDDDDDGAAAAQARPGAQTAPPARQPTRPSAAGAEVAILSDIEAALAEDTTEAEMAATKARWNAAYKSASIETRKRIAALFEAARERITQDEVPF